MSAIWEIVQKNPLWWSAGLVVAAFAAGFEADQRVMGATRHVIADPTYDSLVRQADSTRLLRVEVSSSDSAIKVLSKANTELSQSLTLARQRLDSATERVLIERLDMETSRRVAYFIDRIDTITIDDTWPLTGISAFRNAIDLLLIPPYSDLSAASIYPEFSSVSLRILLARRDSIASPSEKAATTRRLVVVADLAAVRQSLGRLDAPDKIRAVRNRLRAQLVQAFNVDP